MVEDMRWLEYHYSMPAACRHPFAIDSNRSGYGMALQMMIDGKWFDVPVVTQAAKIDDA